MTPPVSPTPTSPTKTWWRTITLVSSELCSSANLVSIGTWWRLVEWGDMWRYITVMSVCSVTHWFCLFFFSTESLDTDGKQMGLPHEYVFLFGVFDEKESKYKPKHHDVDNHVKYTINGYTRGSLPGKCVPYWSFGTLPKIFIFLTKMTSSNFKNQLGVYIRMIRASIYLGDWASNENECLILMSPVVFFPPRHQCLCQRRCQPPPDGHELTARGLLAARERSSARA